MPGVEDCQFDGEVRSLNLPGAGDIKERILFHDSATRTIKYSCFESPGALKSHHASMTVLEAAQSRFSSVAFRAITRLGLARGL